VTAPGLWLRGKIWWIHYYDLHGRRRFERVGPSYKRALRARAVRLAEIESGKFGLRRRHVPSLREFVDGPWRKDIAISLKPSTMKGHETNLKHHLLPYFGDHPLSSITRAAVRSFISKKSKQQRHSYSKKNPNPNRPCLSHKTILNMVALLSAILESAAVDYELLQANPLKGILRRKNFPSDAARPRDKRVRVLEPEDFKRALEALKPPVQQAVLVAALSGLRWGEQVALRIEEDVDFRRNKIRITRSLYQRDPQTPKTSQSVRDVDMSPTVRRMFKAVPWSEGLIFSPDGRRAIGGGSYVKRQWLQAQIDAKIKRPIRWHDLRHQFVSLLIAAGKSPKYIAEQAGHASAGFTLDRYGHLFETIQTTPVEWPEDLLWPSGCHYSVTMMGVERRGRRGEQTSGTSPETLINKGSSG